MGLTASLLIGQSALAASQAALQVTGNNLANAATPGYHRQRVEQTPTQGQYTGPNQFIGRGVSVRDIRRLLDPAIQTRLRDAISQEQSVGVEQSVLDQIEAVTSSTSGNDLNSVLGRFFSAFSELANNPANPTTRSTVVETGVSVAASLRDVRSSLIGQRDQIDSQLGIYVNQANDYISQIASLNQAIIVSEGGQGGPSSGGGGDGALRDQRDTLVSKLSELVDITAIDRGNGAIDVLVNSTPLVLGNTPRPLSLRLQTQNGKLEADVIAGNTNEVLTITSGKIGGLLSQRDGSIQRTLDDIDKLSSSLIYEVNRIHALGRPGTPITDTTGYVEVATADQTRAFNDPANATFAKLPFKPSTGSFQVRLTDANGNSSKTSIPIDLDNITSAGTAGTANDTSLSSLVTALNAVPNLHAQITSAGQLRITTDAGYDVSFSDDTSGVLAALGVNSFFTGTAGDDIAVRADLKLDSSKLTIGSDPGKNEAALAIAALRTTGVKSLSGDTLQAMWSATTGRNGVALDSANTRLDALSTVRQSLEAQDQAISGVSTDEESINLIQYQQQYQGAARFISLVNDLTQVLLGLV